MNHYCVYDFEIVEIPIHICMILFIRNRSATKNKMLPLPFFQMRTTKVTKASPHGNSKGKKPSLAQLRTVKDFNELELPKTCNIDFEDPDDFFNFRLRIVPDEGFYCGGKFVFDFKIGENYPYDPPKVKCITKVYHPNIDLEGNVCLNILREDWKPVLTINSVVYGIQYLFLQPNSEDPLNIDAANELKANRGLFEQNVQRTLHGGTVNGVYFERCTK